MKLGYLWGAAAITFAAAIGTASADTMFTQTLGPTTGCNGCTVTVTVSGSQYTPPSLPFTTLDLGTNAVNGSQSVTIPAGSGITSITFPQPGTVSPFSGVYSGNTSGIALSPFGQTDSTHNYLVAQGGGGEVDVTYAAPQTSLAMLWGTVDPTPSTYNQLQFDIGGDIVTGTDLNNVTGGLLGGANAGTMDVAVVISGLPSFTVLKATDAATAAFEFDVATVPAPAIGQGLPILLAIGGMLVGTRLYRRSKAQSAVGHAAA